MGGTQDKDPLEITGLGQTSLGGWKSAAEAAWQAGSWEPAQAFAELPGPALTSPALTSPCPRRALLKPLRGILQDMKGGRRTLSLQPLPRHHSAVSPAEDVRGPAARKPV